jgi:flagellar basal body-associated protein FliL
MTSALLVLAQSGRGGDSGDSGDGLLILIGVLVVVAILAFLLFRFVLSGKSRGRGDHTGDQGPQPPGRVGH